MPHRVVDDRKIQSWLRQHCMAIAAGGGTMGYARKFDHMIGCTCEEMVSWLGFNDKDPRHIDHIIPLSAGGSWHFTNLRMLAKHTNEKTKLQICWSPKGSFQVPKRSLQTLEQPG